MKINRVLELLKAERECVTRQSPCNEKSKLCDRNCGECDIAQNDLESIEMYDFVISMVEMKSEEAIAPTIGEGAEGEEVIRCGACGTALYHLFPWVKINKAREFVQYCRHCGREVKWE